MASKWTMVLDGAFSNDNVLAEIRNATDRTLTLAFGQPSTASFTVRSDNPIVEALYGLDTKLRIYEDDTLRFHGLCLSQELSTDGSSYPTVKVNAVDPSWIWSKRVVGQQLTSPISGKLRGYVGITRSGDKGKVAKEILEEAMTGSNREAHIDISSTFESESTGTYTAGPFKSALACLNDLANGLDGFDWLIKPIISGESVWGEYYAVPVLGEDNQDVVLEYGENTVGNIRSINYIRDVGSVVNRAFHLPEEMTSEAEEPPVSPLIISSSNRGNNSALERMYFEEVADAPGLHAEDLRQEWVHAVVDIRQYPRRVVAMTLDADDGTGRVPQYGTDWNLGDFVTARGVTGGITLFNGKVRIYQVKIAINENGTAQVTPVLVREESADF